VINCKAKNKNPDVGRLRGLERHMRIYRLLSYENTDEEENVQEVEPQAFINLNGEYYGAIIEDEDTRVMNVDDVCYDKVILLNEQIVFVAEKCIYRQF
jgi:hypothetical protein